MYLIYRQRCVLISTSTQFKTFNQLRSGMPNNLNDHLVAYQTMISGMTVMAYFGAKHFDKSAKTDA